MNVSCSTCLELLSASDDLSSAPCGHVFHSHCILQWFETGKSNCPQCRNRCRESQLRRIFLTESADVSASLAEDPARMQNKMDGLAFQLRCIEKEKKELQEKADQLSAQNTALREEFRECERQKQSVKDSLNEAKSQVTYLRSEKTQAKLAREQAEELRSKLELYTAVDEVINGSMADVNSRLHDLGDFSQASKQLSIIIVALKKELAVTGKENKSLQQEYKLAAGKLGQLRKRLEQDSMTRAHLEDANKALQVDLRHAEEERASLGSKLRRLQEDFNSSKARCSSVDEAAEENMDDTQEEDKEDKSPLSSKKSQDKGDLQVPRTKSESCSLVRMVSKRRSPCKDSTNNSDQQPPPISQFNIMKRSRLAAPSSSAPSSSSQELFYNGLGGHSKPDLFPQMVRKNSTAKQLTSKAQKAKVVPLARKDSTKMNTINKYFNFDTP